MSHPVPPRATEQRNPRSQDIDTFSSAELVDLFLAEDAMVPGAVAAAREEIIATLDLVERTLRGGGRLFYVGAGTSGRLGVLDASECPPTFGTAPELIQGIIAGGPEALVRSIEGAEDDPRAGAAALKARAVTGKDMVVGIAASGATPFVAGAVTAARAAGAATALVTCAEPPAALAAECDAVIRIDVGPELVTGSTRLKAGTATKLVLNQLTTGALVRLGKTYGNLMVDLEARNAKLRDRGERIVGEVLGTAPEVARDAIARAGGSVRTAIVMLHLRVDRAAAEEALDRVDRRLRAIVGPPPRMETP
ncbi:MAG: N-acetylmuramic acid 6-phosphate etherase [Gemmatimonadales bacterium]|nr:N-acetylmuramic acid 6-phosphate etherase [Gemmatimonadales bacterium]